MNTPPSPDPTSSASIPESHFDGRVVLRRLPAFTPPLDAGLPPQKRLLLPAGEISQLADGTVAFRYLACLELVRGTVRGNHFHHRKREWFYLVSGAITLFAAEPSDGSDARPPFQRRLEPGELMYIGPGIAHAVRVEESGTAVEFSPDVFDVADTHRHVVTPV